MYMIIYASMIFSSLGTYGSLKEVWHWGSRSPALRFPSTRRPVVLVIMPFVHEHGLIILYIYNILLHQQTYDHRNECLKQVIFRIKRVSKSQQRLPRSSLLLHCAWLLVHDSSTPLAWRVYDQLMPYDAHISMPIFRVGIHVLSLPCKQSETYDGLFKRISIINYQNHSPFVNSKRLNLWDSVFIANLQFTKG